MTERISVEWPDRRPFAGRDGRPIRILAVSDEEDPALSSAATRERLAPIDLIVGCGDLRPEFLRFLADAFCVPLVYVRGNHDIGEAWSPAALERLGAPLPLIDGALHLEHGLPIIGLGGSPTYSGGPQEVSDVVMWARALRAWWSARGRTTLLVTHAAPKGINDAPDVAHRGFPAFRWLAERLHPPLWLHGHVRLTRRDRASRSAHTHGTLFYNTSGATLVELAPPAGVC